MLRDLILQDASLSGFYSVKSFISTASTLGQYRYPETMGKFYIINAPWGFSGAWTVVKPWLDPVTVSKIDIMGSDFKDKLLQNVKPENLPKSLGVCVSVKRVVR